MPKEGKHVKKRLGQTVWANMADRLHYRWHGETYKQTLQPNQKGIGIFFNKSIILNWNKKWIKKKTAMNSRAM